MLNRFIRKALNIAKDKGWKVVAKDQKAFRFEATAKATFFDFMAYIVIKITPINNESRIDMRSVSRIGRSNKGINAIEL